MTMEYKIKQWCPGLAFTGIIINITCTFGNFSGKATIDIGYINDITKAIYSCQFCWVNL